MEIIRVNIEKVGRNRHASGNFLYAVARSRSRSWGRSR